MSSYFWLIWKMHFKMPNCLGLEYIAQKKVSWDDQEVSRQRTPGQPLGGDVAPSIDWRRAGPPNLSDFMYLPPWLSLEAALSLCSSQLHIVPLLPYQMWIGLHLPSHLNDLQWSVIDTQTALLLQIPPSGKYEIIHIFLADFSRSKLVMKWLSNAAPFCAGDPVLHASATPSALLSCLCLFWTQNVFTKLAKKC